MPSLDLYKKILGSPKTIGEAHKQESDNIMEWTWNNDIDAKIAYFYTQDRDEEFGLRTELHPERTRKIPVEVKFFEMEYNSLSKDEVAYHLLFKPSFDYHKSIPYYDDEFKNPLGGNFPIGLYCDLPDNTGKYNRWLVVAQYRQYSNQFPSYLVLPCDHKLQWVYKGKKYESWCVLRSQNSYNSGLWTDYKITTIQNQKIVWLPFNELTKTIFYDQRIAISQYREDPVVWKTSKIEDMNVQGIIRVTLAQDLWNAHTDFIEKDEDGNVVGMWCDYFANDDVLPTELEDTPTKIYSRISYSGVKPDIKEGGNYKKFTVTFYDQDEVIDYRTGHWSFSVDGEDISERIATLSTEESKDVAINQIKAKLDADNSMIGKILVVGFESDDGIKSELEVNIIGR